MMGKLLEMLINNYTSQVLYMLQTIDQKCNCTIILIQYYNNKCTNHWKGKASRHFHTDSLPSVV